MRGIDGVFWGGSRDFRDQDFGDQDFGDLEDGRQGKVVCTLREGRPAAGKSEESVPLHQVVEETRESSLVALGSDILDHHDAHAQDVQAEHYLQAEELKVIT